MAGLFCPYLCRWVGFVVLYTLWRRYFSTSVYELDQVVYYTVMFPHVVQLKQQSFVKNV